MIACPECGRPLEPFELTSGSNTWTHKPYCWHPDTEEVFGREMSVDKAIELAKGQHEYFMDEADDMGYIIRALEEIRDAHST